MDKKKKEAVIRNSNKNAKKKTLPKFLSFKKKIVLILYLFSHYLPWPLVKEPKNKVTKIVMTPRCLS